MAKTKILMVCLGNICRSPLAEGLLRRKLPFTRFEIDSAGTYGGHAGELPDKRSIQIASQHGLDITDQRSRRITAEDLETFDLIYAMDYNNFQDLTNLAFDGDQKAKINMVLNEIYPGENLDVPDPYHGGASGFKQVYDMLDKATDAIARKLTV